MHRKNGTSIVCRRAVPRRVQFACIPLFPCNGRQDVQRSRIAKFSNFTTEMPWPSFGAQMRPSRRQLQPFTRRWSAGRPSMTVLLIALHTAAFIAQFTVELWQKDQAVHGWLTQWVALSGAGIGEGYLWQFLSFSVLHEGPMPLHLLGNMLILYLAGREVEPIIGPRHFCSLYFIGNILGGITHWLAMPETPLVGVSAGVCAVLAAYATVLPELEITVHLFFVVPLRIRAKYLGAGLFVIAGVLWVSLTAPTIGPAAMLAGLIVGWFYVRQLGFGNPLAIQRYIFEKRQRAARFERMSAEQFISSEIDPILDKVSREGMHSLTRAERRILSKGREKIASRTTRQ